MFNNKAFEHILYQTTQVNAKLVVVTKTRSIESIQSIYQFGHKIFGENRVAELIDKYQVLPKDIEWHMIGHLQRNKVKAIAPFISVIHSIDSLRLLSEVNKQAKNNERTIPCLLQMHIAEEESKYGLDAAELIQLLESPEYEQMQNVQIIGLMGMATFTDDKEKIHAEFLRLGSTFKITKERYFSDDNRFCEMSMGMSGDYQLALECGSTMIRVGSLIFH